MNKPQYILPNWKIPTHVKSLITTRVGGSSVNCYKNFNLATHVDDDYETVIKNRQLLQNILPSNPIWLNQTHSSNVLDLRNSHVLLSNNNSYDAILINNQNQVGVVMTADCSPILLTNKSGSFVGAIHAGWFGVLNNIINKTIQQINLPINNLLIYLGPSICQIHFEVSLDFYEKFILLDKNLTSEFIMMPNNKFLCNLNGIIKKQLTKLGVDNNNIFEYQGCTYCENDKFFSYRRDRITGRIASFIWLE